jgi:hypothetical protein
MANTNTNVSATGSYQIGIDSDDDSTSQTFQVRKHVNTSPVSLLSVDEGGNMTLTGKANLSAGGVVIKAAAGTDTTTQPWSTAQDGEIILCTTNKKLYMKIAGQWYATTPASCW